jgi:mannose-6-phosphate isomerase-like protein (cupin superfamily)
LADHRANFANFGEDHMHSHSAIALIVPAWLVACAASSTAPAPATAVTPAATPAAATATTASAPASATRPGESAPGPEGFAVFSASDLKALGKSLTPKMNEKKSASEPLGKYGNHSAMLGHREGSGEAEFHETKADFFVVQEGEARLVVGGTIENPSTPSPGEIRGSSITGGVTRNLKSGDIVHIPPKVPHQLLLDPGAQFTYFVIKVESPKP